MKAVDVQVITYAPTAFYHCQHCEIAFDQVGLGASIHREQAREALPSDLLDEYALLSDAVRALKGRFGDQVRVRVVDAASLEGFVKSVRFRVRRYPAVIIDGVKASVSPDYEDLISQVEAAAEGVTTTIGR
jgi:hypothetical protein